MGTLKQILKWFVGPRVAPKSEAQKVAEFVEEFIPEPKSVREILDAITRPAVVDKRAQWQAELPSRQRYVCGFAFHGEPGSALHVVLIRKIKPEWQAGKLNGVGGKIEQGETPEQAMAREFNEEAGVYTLPIDWDVFARCEFRGAQVIFLRVFGNLFSCARTTTAEVIQHQPVFRLDTIPDDKIIPNLRWLIPLALHFEDTREVVTVSYGQN